MTGLITLVAMGVTCIRSTRETIGRLRSPVIIGY